MLAECRDGARHWHRGPDAPPCREGGGAPQAGLGTNGIRTTRLCAMDPPSPRMNLPGSVDVTRKETRWPGVPGHLSRERQE